jgi:acylphosphatase
MQLTYSITVSGKVQGVFYRQSTKEKAITLSITGNVMNKKNGDVEIIATGPKEKLDELVDWCRRGPPKAVVKNVIVKELPLQSFERFIIQRF